MLELRTNISVVTCMLFPLFSFIFCCFFFLIICLYISFNEFQGVKIFRGHIFNAGFPEEFFINCDSEVLGIFSGFQLDVMKFIVLLHKSLLIYHLNPMASLIPIVLI